MYVHLYLSKKVNVTTICYRRIKHVSFAVYWSKSWDLLEYYITISLSQYCIIPHKLYLFCYDPHPCVYCVCLLLCVCVVYVGCVFFVVCVYCVCLLCVYIVRVCYVCILCVFVVCVYSIFQYCKTPVGDLDIYCVCILCVFGVCVFVMCAYCVCLLCVYILSSNNVKPLLGT